MKRRMKAAVLYRPLDMRIEYVDVPEVGPNDVLVKTKCVGICGSDVHYYLEGRIGSFIVEKPLILGHECSGEVVEVGEKVTRIKVGQSVVLEPGFVCGKCQYCRKGRYNLCKDVQFYGTPPFNGAFAEFVTSPEQNVHLMPKGMSYEEGAMIEPLAVGMMAARVGGVSASDIIAVMGAGPIGQMALQASRTFGALEVYVTDIVDYRLDYAQKYGAKAAINAAVENVVERVMELTDNEGVDVVIEASGAIPALLQAFDIVKRGGRIVLVGYPPKDVQFPVTKILLNELEIRGIHRYANVFPTAIKAVSTGKAIVKPFVTHRFPLDKILDGFEVHIKRIGNPMKVQIVI